jgi:molecular chaperone DnaK
MEAATKTLTEASHKLAEHMYAQAGPQGPGAGAPGAAPPSGGGAGQGDEVIDAEYVDVDESKR